MNRAAVEACVPFTCGAFTVEPASIEQLQYVAQHLRAKDTRELACIEAFSGGYRSVHHVLMQSFAASVLRFSLTCKGQCLGVGGLAPVAGFAGADARLQTQHQGQGQYSGPSYYAPWLVGTQALEANPQAFGVVARFYRRVVRHYFPYVMNVAAVPIGQQQPNVLRWLASMGFTVCRLAPLTVTEKIQEKIACAQGQSACAQGHQLFLFYTL